MTETGRRTDRKAKQSNTIQNKAKHERKRGGGREGAGRGEREGGGREKRERRDRHRDRQTDGDTEETGFVISKERTIRFT